MPTVISDFFGDQDPRVRTAALKAMVALARLGRTSDGPADLTLVLRVCACLPAAAARAGNQDSAGDLRAGETAIFFFPKVTRCLPELKFCRPAGSVTTCDEQRVGVRRRVGCWRTTTSRFAPPPFKWFGC